MLLSQSTTVPPRNGTAAIMLRGVGPSERQRKTALRVAVATASSLAEAAVWLCGEAVRRYPNSLFAKRYAPGFV
jgi:hypothetical protein